LTELWGGANIWLKREDLAHTGAQMTAVGGSISSLWIFLCLLLPGDGVVPY
jgi:hypothetical protein